MNHINGRQRDTKGNAKPTGDNSNARGKENRSPSHNPAVGGNLGDPLRSLTLHRLSELADADRVYVTESKKCADLVRSLGLIATTSGRGAQSVHKTDWTALSAKRVIILPSLGSAGSDYADAVAKQLAKLKDQPEVRVVCLPGLTKEGDDIEQWLQERDWQPVECIRDELEQIAAETAPLDRDQDTGDDADDEEPHTRKSADEGITENRKSREPSQSEALIKLGEAATYSRTPEGKAYARIRVGDHDEVYAVRNKAFKQWLTHLFYVHGRRTAPSSEAMQSALSTLEAKAAVEGEVVQVHLRVAGVNGSDGPTLYLDLVDECWRAVEVNAQGWEVVENPPVLFRRTNTMRPLPEPTRGGSIDDLRQFVNVGSEDDFRLFVAVLCAYLRPTGPYPVLVIQGEQGSAKSTTTRIVGRLIDPSSILRSPPHSVRDLMIAANLAWVMTMDNLSGLPAPMSDALCRLATGGGCAFRTLYSDDEETVFDAMRPIVLNGIDDIAERTDLLDRSVVLNLRRITPGQRLTEQEFWGRFDALAPTILGALLDAVEGGLREMPNVHPDRSPRMADFARFGEAVGRALGWGEGALLAAFERNQSTASVTVLEACPVVSAVLRLMSHQVAWSGTATELLERLRKLADESTVRNKEWPQKPNVLSNKLKRIAPALRAEGIEIEFGHSGKKKIITLKKPQPEIACNSSSASTVSTAGGINGLSSNSLGRNDPWGSASTVSTTAPTVATAAPTACEVLRNDLDRQDLGDQDTSENAGSDDTVDDFQPISGGSVGSADEEEDQQWTF
jgi:hypothetical protein